MPKNHYTLSFFLTHVSDFLLAVRRRDGPLRGHGWRVGYVRSSSGYVRRTPAVTCVSQPHVPSAPVPFLLRCFRGWHAQCHEHISRQSDQKRQRLDLLVSVLSLCGFFKKIYYLFKL